MPSGLQSPPKLGIASLSLGSFEFHSLSQKIKSAAAAGFENIELFDLDWWNFRDNYAQSHNLKPCERDGDVTSLIAAQALGDLVKSYGMRISCWQPLRNFEGFVCPIAKAKSRAYAKGILDLCPALGTTLVLSCTTSTPAPATSGSLENCVEDIAWLADEGAKYDPPIRIMYEGLSFAAHRTSWQDAWEVVEKANRPNLGLCLDSFNTLALEWADPYSISGTLSPDVDSLLDKNLAELVMRVPGDKIFFFQVADGRKMNPPLPPPTDLSIPRIRPWSRSWRLFPNETELGAYLPVGRFSDAVIRTGYTGPWSLEVFNNSLADQRREVPMEHATRAMRGLKSAMEESYARVSNDQPAIPVL